VNGAGAPTDCYTVVCRGELSGMTGFRIEALHDPETKKGPGRRSDGNFVLTSFRVEVVDSDGTSRPVSLTNAAVDFAQKGFPASSSLDDDPGTGWAILPQTNQRHVVVFETARDLTLAAGESLGWSWTSNTGKATPSPGSEFPPRFPRARSTSQRSAIPLWKL
jgi:hypothetical protein